MKVLVLGVTGMLGSAAFLGLSQRPGLTVTGTSRGDRRSLDFLPDDLARNVATGIDAEAGDALFAHVARIAPNAVINCIGLVKQLAAANDPVAAISINALLPHRLARACADTGARLIHISTDCVFSGRRGGYRESDVPDAEDLYGRSKLLGEVDAPHAVTLRTSIIGPEINGRHGLLEWFLAQNGRCKGYRKAIFSGVTTDHLTDVIADHVLPRPDLHGLYQVSAAPIDKYRLLQLIRDAFELPTAIDEDDRVVIDRSLNSDRFRQATGYAPPEWPEMIKTMHQRSRARKVPEPAHV